MYKMWNGQRLIKCDTNSSTLWDTGQSMMVCSGEPIKVQWGAATPFLLGKVIIGVVYYTSAQHGRYTLGIQWKV